MKITRVIVPVVLAGSLAVNGVFAGVFATYAKNRGGWAYIRARVGGPPVMVTRVAPDLPERVLYRAVPKVPGQYLFMGDSLIEGGPWNDFFPGVPVQNRGVGGSTVLDGVNLVADGVLSGRPAKLFLMYGVNDFGHGTTVDGLLQEYARLLDAVHAASPGTKVYIQSTLPSRWIAGDRADADDVRGANDRLRGLAAARGCTYIDVYSHVASDPQCGLPADLTVDGIHLTLKGYLIWIDVLRPYVSEPVPAERP